jgi:hypothetical protein
VASADAKPCVFHLQEITANASQIGRLPCVSLNNRNADSNAEIIAISMAREKLASVRISESQQCRMGCGLV